MKITLVSIVAMHNYGGTMQNYAMCTYLKSLGYNVELLYYQSLDDFYESNFIEKISWDIIKAFMGLRIHKFKKFSKENIPLTHRYKTMQSVINNPPESDVYLIGSDQVWNKKAVGENPIYTLEWVKHGIKMSYSASIGEKDIDQQELNRLFNAIKDFRFVAVREACTKNHLTKIGIKNVEHVMDPVFLLDKNDYMKFIRPNKYGKYTLVLAYERNSVLHDIVLKVKDITKAKMIEVGNSTKKYVGSGDTFKRNVGPEEILSLIYHADMIVTSSFHTIAFCLIFNKRFVTTYSHMAPERIEDVLKLAGVSDCIVTDTQKINAEYLNREYTYANDSLKQRIGESKKWLTEALKQCEN